MPNRQSFDSLDGQVGVGLSLHHSLGEHWLISTGVDVSYVLVPMIGLQISGGNVGLISYDDIAARAHLGFTLSFLAFR